MNKKYYTIFPVSGHIEVYELLYAVVLREAYEESALKVMFYNDEEQLQLGRVGSVLRPKIYY